MEPLWTIAVGLLAPFVTKTGEKLAEKVGETLFGEIKKFFTRKKDAAGKKALKAYEGDPEIYAGALEKYLERKTQDKEFLAMLTEQVAIAQAKIGTRHPIENISVTQRVDGNAKVGQVIGVAETVNIHSEKPNS